MALRLPGSWITAFPDLVGCHLPRRERDGSIDKIPTIRLPDGCRREPLNAAIKRPFSAHNHQTQKVQSFCCVGARSAHQDQVLGFGLKFERTLSCSFLLLSTKNYNGFLSGFPQRTRLIQSSPGGQLRLESEIASERWRAFSLARNALLLRERAAGSFAYSSHTATHLSPKPATERLKSHFS